MPHIKLPTDFDQSPWLVSLDAAAQLAWVKLLCHFAKGESTGFSELLNSKAAAERFALPVDAIERMLEAAHRGGALITKDDCSHVSHWAQVQTSLREDEAELPADPMLPFDFEGEPTPSNVETNLWSNQ